MKALQRYLRKKKIPESAVRLASPRVAHIAASLNTATKVAELARSLTQVDGSLPPADTPLTLLVLRHDARLLPWEEFLQRCRSARTLHKQAYQASATSRCLDHAIYGDEHVPRYYFSGADEREGIFLVALQQVQGHVPRFQHNPKEFARVEKALLSLWILGFSSADVTKADVVVRRDGTAFLLNFANVRPLSSQWRRTKAANTLSVSQTSQAFSEWEPPAWLALSTSSSNLATLAAARQQTWRDLLPC